MKLGVFVVVEGPDGSGKSTLTERIKAKLAASGVAESTVCISDMDSSLEFIHSRQPGGTPFAEKIRGLLLAGTGPDEPDFCLATQYYLFSAARAHLMSAVIAPALKAGKIVICERHILSSLVHQGLCLDAINSGFEFVPDVTIFANTPWYECISRIRSRPAGDYFENMPDAEIHKTWRRYHELVDDAQNATVIKIDCSYDDAAHESQIASTVDTLVEMAKLRRGEAALVSGREFELAFADAESCRVILRTDVDLVRVKPYTETLDNDVTFGELKKILSGLLGNVPYCIETAIHNPLDDTLLGDLRMTTVSKPIRMLSEEDA